MLNIKTILCPIDFSKQSSAAFHLASSLARDYQARLVLTYVKIPPEVVYGEFGMSPPEVDDEDYKEQLMTVEPDDKTITVEHFFRKGQPAKEIVKLAQEENADLIVMGTHGRGGLTRMLMGSVAEHVMREAPCPVVTMKHPASELNEMESQKANVNNA